MSNIQKLQFQIESIPPYHIDTVFTNFIDINSETNVIQETTYTFYFLPPGSRAVTDLHNVQHWINAPISRETCP